MHSNRPLFAPEPSSAGEYVMVVLTLLNNFHKTLRERQSQCLNKVQWGQPVIPGKHASFTIDRKHRGIRNPYDTDPNAAESDDGTETEEGAPQTEEGAACGYTDSVVVIHSELLENEQREKAVPVCEQPKVPVHTEEPLISVPSVSEDFPYSNQDENQKSTTKRQKLCKKLGSNKENRKQKVKVHCLQRRSLFRKARQEVLVSPILPSDHETQDVKSNQMATSLSNNLSNGKPMSPDTNSFRKSMLDVSTVLPCKNETLDLKTEQMQETLFNVLPNEIITSLDMNTAELKKENPIPCGRLSIVPISPVSKEFPLSDKSSSPPRTLYGEHEKTSPLRESNPSSNSCEIRSSSPVFSAYESPFRNSEFIFRLKEKSVTQSEESAVGSVGHCVTNPEKMSSDAPHSKRYSRLSKSEDEDAVNEHQKKTKKLKTVISKRLQKQRPMVQCPLCGEWFKPKVIETHAANCGINPLIQPYEQQHIADSTSVPNENDVEKETCDLNRPSECEDSKPDPLRNTDSILEAESLETAADVQNMECHLIRNNNNSKEPIQQLPTSPDVFVLEPVGEKSVIAFENDTTGQQQMETLCVPPEIQAKALSSVPVLKRCFICDLSYVEGKPFLTHLRSCRKNYQKLRRQFTDFSEENEEPQRKTRSRHSLGAT